MKGPSDNALKYFSRTKRAREKIHAIEGKEKKFLSLKVEDKNKITIKIQLSETNFVTTTEQEGQLQNCLYIVRPNVRAARFFIVLSTQGEWTVLSLSHFY